MRDLTAAEIQRRREYQKKWVAKNPEKVKAIRKRYLDRHPDRVIAYRQRTREEHNKKSAEVRYRVKVEVLTYYGRGRCACIQCGESRLACLSIDHINGEGARHRKQLKTSEGQRFYDWLRKNNYPEGYQTLCMNCQWVKRTENKEWSHRPSAVCEE